MGIEITPFTKQELAFTTICHLMHIGVITHSEVQMTFRNLMILTKENLMATMIEAYQMRNDLENHADFRLVDFSNN